VIGTVISLSSLGLSDGAPVDTVLPSDPFTVAPLSLISNPSENVSDNWGEGQRQQGRHHGYGALEPGDAWRSEGRRRLSYDPK
jgi:hypothetical protein